MSEHSIVDADIDEIFRMNNPTHVCSITNMIPIPNRSTALGEVVIESSLVVM